MRVTLDREKCALLASVLGAGKLPDDKEDFECSGLSQMERGNYYLFIVAICHQTQQLKGWVGGDLLRGWDYLSRKFLAYSLENRRYLQPRVWRDLNPDDLVEIFIDSEYGSTLSGVEGRASLLNNLGEVLVGRNYQYVEEIYLDSRKFLIGENGGMLKRLSEAKSFSDPVRKKLYFFLGLMANAGLWTYEDIENLGAPVDYHEIRGHLRVGTIKILCEDLKQKVLSGERLTDKEDVLLRSRVHEAIVEVSSALPGAYPMKLHYFFWNYFRNICLRKSPHCFSEAGKLGELLPGRYRTYFDEVGGSTKCVLGEICMQRDVEAKYLEYSCDTEWY